MVLVTMVTQITGHPMVTNPHIIFKSGRTGTETDGPNNLPQLTKQCQCKIFSIGCFLVAFDAEFL